MDRVGKLGRWQSEGIGDQASQPPNGNSSSVPAITTEYSTHAALAGNDTCAHFLKEDEEKAQLTRCKHFLQEEESCCTKTE